MVAEFEKQGSISFRRDIIKVPFVLWKGLEKRDTHEPADARIFRLLSYHHFVFTSSPLLLLLPLIAPPSVSPSLPSTMIQELIEQHFEQKGTRHVLNKEIYH